jgi:hypothetical protein
MNNNSSLEDARINMDSLRRAITLEKQEIQRLFKSREFDAMPVVHQRLARLEREAAMLSQNPAKRVQARQG